MKILPGIGPIMLGVSSNKAVIYEISGKKKTPLYPEGGVMPVP